MKSLMLIAATFVLIVAQTAAVDAQSPKLSLLSTKVELVPHNGDSRADQSAARVKAYPDGHMETESAFDRTNDAADRRSGKRYRLSVVVRNDDSKTIRAVQFEYPVHISRGRTSPEQITFKSQKEIGPSDTVTLSYTFITNQYVFRFGQATVKRIEYTDGSVWPR
jgi:hypothetical protein